jgi:hypothetical protein
MYAEMSPKFDPVGGLPVSTQHSRLFVSNFSLERHTRAPSLDSLLLLHIQKQRQSLNMALNFTLPPIQDNEDGSWGPSTSTLPSQFQGYVQLPPLSLVVQVLTCWP